MSKKISIIIAIVIVLILATGGVFAYLYFSTDLLKTDKQAFFKYISKNAEAEDSFDVKSFFSSDGVEAYYEKQQVTPYISSGSIKTDVTFQDSSNADMASAIQNCSIYIDGKVDKLNNYSYKTIKANYSDDQGLQAEILHNGDIYAIRIDDVLNKFLGIENNNLKEFATKMGFDEEVISNIPDKIDFSSIQNTKIFTDEELSQEIEKYSQIIQNNLTDDMFSKEEVDGNNVYVLTLTNEQLLRIMTQILNTVENDDVLFNSVKRYFSQNNMEWMENNVNTYIDKIKEEIQYIRDELNEEIMDTDRMSSIDFKIKAHTNGGNLLKTEIVLIETIDYSKLDDSNDYSDLITDDIQSNSNISTYTVTITNIENGLKIDLSNDVNENTSSYTIQKKETASDVAFTLTAFSNNEQIFEFSIEFQGIDTDTVTEISKLDYLYNQNSLGYNTAEYDSDFNNYSKSRFIWTYKNTKTFVAEITRDDVENSDILLVNTAPSAESVQSLVGQAITKFTTVNNEKMTNAGLIKQADEEETFGMNIIGAFTINPFIYYIPAIIPVGVDLLVQNQNEYITVVATTVSTVISTMGYTMQQKNSINETTQQIDLLNDKEYENLMLDVNNILVTIYQEVYTNKTRESYSITKQDLQEGITDVNISVTENGDGTFTVLSNDTGNVYIVTEQGQVTKYN